MKKNLNLIILFLLISFIVTNNVTLIFGENMLNRHDSRKVDDNMWTTKENTAINSQGVKINWSKRYSNDYGPTSQQIIVDDTLIFTVKETLFKVNKNNGEIINTVKMAGSTKYSQIPPTYGDEKIFVPIGNGKIQAFDAKTFKSLWIYEDVLEGDIITPITYSKGYIYTGFWKSDTEYANYVCLSVKDEDIKNKYEGKKDKWVKSSKGGYYNAGALIVGDIIVFGSDNGSKDRMSNSYIYALDKKTGKELSKVKVIGDQRSSIYFNNNKIYFTTNSGYLYSGKLDKLSGKITNLKKVYYNLESTCTPVIYKNRIYIGFGIGKNGRIIVADENSLEEIYNVKINGTPNASILLSNAYENETNKIYLYVTYDDLPGQIRVIETTSNAIKNDNIKSNNLINLDYYKQGYGKNSVICDEEGDLYYSNNLGYIFSIGKKNKIQVNFNPNNKEDVITKEIYENEALYYIPDKPVKEGYEFVDWFIDINDDSTRYKYGNTYTESTVYSAKYNDLNSKTQNENNKDDKKGNNELKHSSERENNNKLNKDDTNKDKNDRKDKSNSFILTSLFMASAMGVFIFLNQGKK